MNGTGTFAGQVALITGATSGIGAATAQEFARRGAIVVAAGRDGSRGAEVVAAIAAEGGEASFVAADLCEPGAVSAMVDAVLERHGRLDHACNNAGIFDRMHELHRYSDESWDEMIAVNLTAVFQCMRAEIDAMIASPGNVSTGRCIVNNASTVAHRGSVRASPGYVAAKHGVLGLTRQAAVQYVRHGIRVNAVSPGPTRTPVADDLVAEGPDVVRETLSLLNPRAEFVTAEEVAQVTAFLCSPAAYMINGHAIPIDGGQLAGM